MPIFTWENFGNAVKVLAALGGFIGFLTAVSTYLRTERWKRAEFLAHEMKEFFTTPRVQTALLLIDWGSRRIKLLENVPPESAFVVVDRDMQSRGLLPHVLLGADGADPGSMAVKETADSESSGDDLAEDGSPRSDRFTQPEAAIRDCYDAFLDGLERFASYVKTKRSDKDSLRPYIGYWIDDISDPAVSRGDATWNATLLTYISFYRFNEVLWLFSEFGKDIGPKSTMYAAMLKQMEDQALAKSLAGTVGLDWQVASEQDKGD
jgi:hypothetical protein